MAISKNPIVIAITTTTIFENFDSLSLVDVGSSGFRLQDAAGNIGTIPTGVCINVGAPAGMLAGKLIVLAPVSGSLNVTAVVYY
jgi:hypothetical protein